MLQLYTYTALKLLALLLLPGAFWLYFFAGDKELFQKPLKSLMPTFLMGIIVSVPALAIEYFCVIITRMIQNEVTVLLTSFLIIAPLEEYLKSLGVDIGGYKKNDPLKTPQILAWYISSAIGFASIENVLYFFVFGGKIFAYRVILTTIAHICCSGVIGYCIGINSNKTKGFIRGFFIATILHGAYDYTLSIYSVTIWVWVPILLLIGAFLESKLENIISEKKEINNY